MTDSTPAAAQSKYDSHSRLLPLHQIAREARAGETNLSTCFRSLAASGWRELTAVDLELQLQYCSLTQTSKRRNQTSRVPIQTMEANQYSFTAMRGIQAGKAFFVLLCPLKLVPKLFRFDDESVPPEFRAQRILNRARVPEIARYIVDNPKEYILSSLCASVDGEVDFEPIQDKGAMRCIGILHIGMSCTILINDGQHRRAAIEEAVKERPELGDETISVVLFADGGLGRSQQMFADLNVHATKPTKSIRLLYDHRDELAQLSREVVQRVALFREFTDLEVTSLSNRTLKLFTFSSLHQAIFCCWKRPGMAHAAQKT